MSISEAREDLQRRLASFLWDQWAQMGILATASGSDRWAADPEALLLLSFEVGREEPRLFEEVLDWMATNERLISVQRLRNLVKDDEDRALVEAVVGWLGQRRRRPRLEARKESAESREAPQPFFRGSSRSIIADLDPAFLAQGFLKPRSEPSQKSRAPNVLAPINFAFRLRLLLGIGARAEAMRFLLTVDAPGRDAQVNVQVIAKSTAYTKRNAQEAVAALRDAGALNAVALGNEQRFSAPRERWARFLELDELPRQVDWPQLFTAYRRVLRWLADPAHEGLSDYMLASEARTLAEEVAPDLRFAGVFVDSIGVGDQAYLEGLLRLLREQLP